MNSTATTTVTVVDKNNNSVSYSSIPDHIKVRIECDVYRNTTFHTDYNYLEQGVPYAPYINANELDGEIEVEWRTVKGADEYEMEWAYLEDDYATLQYGDVEEVFAKNASRIVTKDNTYSFPAVYESGNLYFRYRAINYDDGARVYGDWASWMIMAMRQRWSFPRILKKIRTIVLRSALQRTA
jgi:hypothetical protein